jgi:hypothetical protein
MSSNPKNWDKQPPKEEVVFATTDDFQVNSQEMTDLLDAIKAEVDRIAGVAFASAGVMRLVGSKSNC